MTNTLPDNPDRDDITEYVDEQISNTEKSLQDQIDALQKHVDALEGELERVADVVRGLEDERAGA